MAPSNTFLGASAIDEDRYSFAAFATQPFFVELNRRIVDRVMAQPRRTVVDLGCGPGAVTRLIVEHIPPGSPGHVIGIDPSESALARAREAVRSSVAEFISGTAERLSRIVSSADAVVFLNAIHLVPDKASVLAEIRKVLPVGGVLAFNTTFFNGAYVEGTSGIWRRWVVRSAQVLKERGIEMVRGAKATAMQWLSPDEYTALLRAAGFGPPAIQLVPVEMSKESLADISRFSLFIEGALPGVPLPDACAALQEGLNRTLTELEISGVPRNWLQCVATAV
jgi:ubiquinone/menaquinone biosynthesis C-methylase UbiE